MLEALVIVPPVVVRLVIVPLVDQRLVPVRLVDEAFVKVAVVENRVGAVRMEVEALTKLVCPETVKLPPRYVLPVEWTEKREPGVVVPIPTLPPNVAKPEDRSVVVVALVAAKLLIQAVSLTVK